VSEDAPGPIPDSPTEVEAIMLLCDSAQSVGGKLYILGGGWSQAPAVAPEALPMGLAIRMLVPWDRTNEHIPVKIRLLTDRGIAVTDAAGAPVEATTALEVGRPPGLPRGTALDAALALNFMGLTLEEGSYVWVLEAEDKTKARAPFRVTGPNQGAT
jgi:hypothetical protein